MTPAKVARRRWVAQEIARDAERDAAALDGRPFTAVTVAEQFGFILASVQALANLVDHLYADAYPGIEPKP